MESLEADQGGYELSRLMLMVKKQRGCWPWQGFVGSNGYGQATFYGHLTSAHRAVFMASHRIRLKKSQFVLHRCDNPACCRLSHLYVGTHAENMRDCMERKRHVSFVKPETFVRGSKCHLAKITESDVLRIREMCALGFKGREIAEIFPITITAVFKIKHRKCWKHVI